MCYSKECDYGSAGYPQEGRGGAGLRRSRSAAVSRRRCARDRSGTETNYTVLLAQVQHEHIPTDRLSSIMNATPSPVVKLKSLPVWVEGCNGRLGSVRTQTVRHVPTFTLSPFMSADSTQRPP